MDETTRIQIDNNRKNVIDLESGECSSCDGDLSSSSFRTDQSANDLNQQQSRTEIIIQNNQLITQNGGSQKHILEQNQLLSIDHPEQRAPSE